MPSPQTPHRRFDLSRWRPPRSALLWALGAFLLGVAAFLVVWSGSRDREFYRPDARPASAGEQYAPLPAPLPAGSSDLDDPLRRPPPDYPEGERPQLVETAPPPPPPASPAPAPAPESAPPVAIRSQPVPVPGQTPTPRYPARALRRGESGTVLVQVDVGPDGVPTSVRVTRGSGSRTLDRAAVDAVRRWRFQPAQRADGQPTVGTVNVPIDFSPR
ncbi:MAG: TonB family protein [Pseudomonadota bacterium]|nr:TonB family protein [Pseudomonadota bacterium]